MERKERRRIVERSSDRLALVTGRIQNQQESPLITSPKSHNYSHSWTQSAPAAVNASNDFLSQDQDQYHQSPPQSHCMVHFIFNFHSYMTIRYSCAYKCCYELMRMPFVLYCYRTLVIRVFIHPITKRYEIRRKIIDLIIVIKFLCQKLALLFLDFVLQD